MLLGDACAGRRIVVDVQYSKTKHAKQIQPNYITNSLKSGTRLGRTLTEALTGQVDRINGKWKLQRNFVLG